MGFVGSGLAGACTDAHGVWSNLIGTAYSMESFIRKERLKAVINGTPHTLNGEMHRAAGTGVLCSTACFEDVVVYVADFAIMHRPYVTRVIAAHNRSGQAIDFNTYVEIKRPTHATYHPDMKNDAAGETALTLVQPNSRLMTIKFAGQATAVRIFDEETEVVLDTPPRKIKPARPVSSPSITTPTQTNRPAAM